MSFLLVIYFLYFFSFSLYCLKMTYMYRRDAKHNFLLPPGYYRVLPSRYRLTSVVTCRKFVNISGKCQYYLQLLSIRESYRVFPSLPEYYRVLPSPTEPVLPLWLQGRVSTPPVTVSMWRTTPTSAAPTMPSDVTKPVTVVVSTQVLFYSCVWVDIIRSHHHQ
jgi:hypothetical protein